MLASEMSSSDVLRRKREQNKIAQRKHRRKAREQLDAFASLERLLGETNSCARQSKQNDQNCESELVSDWTLADQEKLITWDALSPTEGEILSPSWLASGVATAQSSRDSSCHIPDSISDSTISIFGNDTPPHFATVIASTSSGSSSSDLDEMSTSIGMDTNIIENHIPISADISQATGLSPLHVAAKEGHLDCVDLLLACGSNINQRDDTLLTALHHATLGGYISVVQRLIHSGAQANATDATGMTALHHAAAKGDVAIVACLLDTDADLANPTGWCS